MSTPLEKLQQRVHEQRHQELQQRLNEHIGGYSVKLAFPAEVSSSTAGKEPRTNKDLIQHRLLEAGVLLDDVQKLGEVTEAISKFVTNLEESGCYNAVQVKVGNNENETTDKGIEESKNENDDESSETVQVVLNEKRWYSAYIGGGLKHDSLYSGDSSSALPKVQFETRAKLLNLTGHLDTTSVNYAIDQTSVTTVSVEHERPLYSAVNEYSAAYNYLLSAVERGSQVSLSCRAVLDTLDHEWTRSYKEHQRLLSVKVASGGHKAMPELALSGYRGLEWSLLFRDLLPRRHSSLPYALDASPEILAQAGPSIKHSVAYETRSNDDVWVDNKFNPTVGMCHFAKMELAGPPGDVGFWKFHGGLSYHIPFSNDAWSFHGAIQAGLLKTMSYGGLCPRNSIADRFFVGGPLDLRGFVPAGIGPRAPTGGASTPGGDSLGGNVFYTGTLAASMPFPAVSFLSQNGVRLFGFANVGTLAGLDSYKSTLALLKSTRVCIGGGVSAGTPFGRLEATYAYPLRHGPRDARKSVQIGLGFHFA